MEDLSTRWKKLSLSESEENRVALRIDRRKRGFILAGKFFTRRSLNIEAVAKTFCCLLLNWKLMRKELFKVNRGLLTGILLSLKNLTVMLLFTHWVLNQQPFGCKFIICIFPSKLLKPLLVLERLLDL